MMALMRHASIPARVRLDAWIRCSQDIGIDGRQCSVWAQWVCDDVAQCDWACAGLEVEARGEDVRQVGHRDQPNIDKQQLHTRNNDEQD